MKLNIGDRVINIDKKSDFYNKVGTIVDHSLDLKPVTYLVFYEGGGKSPDWLHRYNWTTADNLGIFKSTLEQQDEYFNKDQFEEQMEKISDLKLYTPKGLNKIIKEKEEELKNKYNKAIFNLTDSIKEKNELLDYADKQLDSMANKIEAKDKVIRELSEMIIKITNKEDL